MATQPKYFTRKDLATILECSVMSIRRNERTLGLTLARVDINSRTVRYRSKQVIAILSRKGLWEL